MFRVTMEDGTVVNFNNKPTPEDVDAAYKQITASKAPAPAPEKPRGGVMGFGDTLGTAAAVWTDLLTGQLSKNLKAQNETQDMTNALALQISKMKKEGKDTSRAELQYKNLTGNDLFHDGVGNVAKTGLGDIYGETANKTNKQIIGEGVSTGAATLLGTSAPTALGRMGIGTAVGGLSGAGSSLSENKGGMDVAKDTLKGASIGLALSGIFEGLWFGLRKYAETKGIQNKSANIYIKELQPKASEIAADIERTPAGEAFKTIGATIRDQVDDAGKPLYVGDYNKMLNTAKTTISSKWNKLIKTLWNYDDVAITKKEVAGDIMDEMVDRMGSLTKAEKNTIEREISRIAEDTINPSDALRYKRLYDSKIPDSFFADTADRTKSIAVQSRYILRDNLRKLINEKTGDATVKELNQAMGIAMDVRRLTASQLAQRAGLKIGGQGGVSPFKYIYEKVIDDFMFNPALTTRFAQGLKSMGQVSGKGSVAQTTKNIITNEAAK